MCGAVTYTATGDKAHLTACHCTMCRQWTGGPLLSYGPVSLSFADDTHVSVHPSSAWAERAFCSKCGSSLYYRLTAEGPYHGNTSVAFGTLDDQAGFEMTTEWFIDKKPDSYGLVGERRCITEAEAFAMLSD